MNWKKLGCIIKPDPKVSWMSEYVGPSFVEVVDDIIKVYVTGRDKENKSRIGVVAVDGKDMKTILNISKKPLFDLGEIGCFDESGVSYPWIVNDGDKSYMYYVGWVAGGMARFQNFTGVAESTDNNNSFKRITKAPILERTNEEPIGSGSVCVLKDEGIWKIWYTSFVRWEKQNDSIRHYYHLKYAESSDGVHWKREGRVAIDFKDDTEYSIAKPMVIKEDGYYKMWYSYRGDDYRIGYAESDDGMTWVRKDDKVGIDVSNSGWDSEMVEYAYVFDYNKQRYMIYNGNNFGKTGLGLAILESE